MLRRSVLLALTVALFSPGSIFGAGSDAALKPPMGWNSWDAFGLTISESEFERQSKFLAGNLKQFGWNYSVVDEGWYLRDPSVKPENFTFILSPEGLYLPAIERYPSAVNGAGFKPVADYVHSLGLKFGIHIIRGIPKEAVAKNLPIGGSPFHAADAADTSDTCPWNTYNWGAKTNEAGQAYYDSMARLYASWGVDFLKVDCISSHPYKPDEIRMISEALNKTGREIVLSLSPGPTPVGAGTVVEQYSNMWRISDDIWDHWAADPTISFSPSLPQQFTTAAQWTKYAGPGHWPDADMLPFGYLGPRPGQNDARQTRLTPDEVQTVFTGWLIFRSPLILGANLLRLDGWTRSLITNREAIAVNQDANGQREALRDGTRAIWTSHSAGNRFTYIAVFNLGDAPATFEYGWDTIGLSAAAHEVRDIWARKDLGSKGRLQVALKPHASALFRVH